MWTRKITSACLSFENNFSIVWSKPFYSILLYSKKHWLFTFWVWLSFLFVSSGYLLCYLYFFIIELVMERELEVNSLFRISVSRFILKYRTRSYFNNNNNNKQFIGNGLQDWHAKQRLTIFWLACFSTNANRLLEGTETLNIYVRLSIKNWLRKCKFNLGRKIKDIYIS